MKSKTRLIVCIAVALCIVLAAGTAFAAPHNGGGHGSYCGVQASGKTAGTRHAACTYPDSPRLTGGAGACVNENCMYYQECPNEDCPRLDGGTCSNEDCPYGGERPQDGTGYKAGENAGNSTGNGAGNSRNSGLGNGHHSGRHH